MNSTLLTPPPGPDAAGELALLRLVLRETPAALAAVAGPDHRFTYCNARYVANSDGRARVGQPLAACMPEFVAQGFVAVLDEVYRTGQPFEQDDVPVRLYDPVSHRTELFYFTSAARPLRDVRGQVTGVLIFAVDATAPVRAHRAAEQALAEQREFYETLLQELPAGVVAFDPQHRYRWANSLLHQQAGFHDTMLGLTNAEAGAARGYPPALTAERERRFAQAVREHRDVGWEERVPGPEGQERDWLRRMRPVYGPDGALRLVVATGLDITELKQAQRAATGAVQSQEDFLATMSHEIRTPLNGVLGMAGLLAKTDLDAPQRRYLDVVQHSGRHLLALLNDVLDMAKIRSGQLHLEAVPVRLDDALREAAQALAWQAQEKGLVLKVQVFKVPPPVVITDPMRLSQVVLNLLGNALKFTERGQVSLHAAVRHETTTHLCVHFHVRDTGPGVPPAVQEGIFDAFAQATTDTTRRYGGTGLGLAISSRLVQQLGGHLVLCNEPGHGSTFGFTLLLAKTTAPVALPLLVPAPDASPLRGWRALVVDDNALNRELARAVLEQNGAVVDATASGQQALALFEQHRYDAVLMDVHMPGMDGLEATARIRQHSDPARAATPVLALTANAFPAQHASYRAAGMSEVLAKPFTEAELLAKLAALAPASTAGPNQGPRG